MLITLTPDHVIFAATQFWRNKIVEIAKDYPDMTFAIVDEDDFPEMIKGFGFEDSGEEMNVGIMDKYNRKYPMEEMEEFDADEIREFINKYKKGMCYDLFVYLYFVFCSAQSLFHTYL